MTQVTIAEACTISVERVGPIRVISEDISNNHLHLNMKGTISLRHIFINGKEYSDLSYLIEELHTFWEELTFYTVLLSVLNTLL